MGESRRLWFGARGWAGDVCFSVVAGACLGVVGPFGTFLQASLPFRLAYWTALFCVGAGIYGLAIRGAVSLDGRLRAPGALWLLVLILVASGPMSAISALVATHVWPVLKAMSPMGWYSQSAAVSAPLVLTYGVLTRRLAPFGRRPATPPEAGGPVRVGRLPERLTRGLVCLQMEDHYVRVHTRAGSELVLISMRDAVTSLRDREGERVHRSWWVARQAVTGVVADGRNLRLRLLTGVEAPISRSHVARLRAAGWLAGKPQPLEQDLTLDEERC